eukprot:2035434-Rhodomonas_salina.1
MLEWAHACFAWCAVSDLGHGVVLCGVVVGARADVGHAAARLSVEEFDIGISSLFSGSPRNLSVFAFLRRSPALT